MPSDEDHKWLNDPIDLPSTLPCGHGLGEYPNSAQVIIELTETRRFAMVRCGECLGMHVLLDEPL